MTQTSKTRETVVATVAGIRHGLSGVVILRLDYRTLDRYVYGVLTDVEVPVAQAPRFVAWFLSRTEFDITFEAVLGRGLDCKLIYVDAVDLEPVST